MRHTGNEGLSLSNLQPHTAAVLRMLYQIGEASNVGPLKGVAGVGSLVLEKCMLATRNQEEAKHLSQRIFDLLSMIRTHLYNRGVLTSSEVGFLEELEETLRGVGVAVQVCFGKRQFFSRLAGKADADLRLLQKHDHLLRDALARFQTLIYIDTRKAIVSHETQLKISKEHLREYLNSTMADVVREVRSNMHKLAAGDGRIPATFEEHCPPQFFFGRELELKAISATLKNTHAANIAILGLGGIGKTSLAKRVLYNPEVESVYGKRRYFVSCEGDTTSDGFLTSLGRQLGLKGPNFLKQILDFLGGTAPLLLVLDNLESPWDSPERLKVEEQLAAISGLQNVALLVTMRGGERPSRVEWTRPFLPALKPLDEEPARRLFFVENECDEADSAVDELLTRVDCIPLAVTLLSSMAQVEEPAKLLERYEEESTSMLAKGDGHETSVDVSIQLSLQCNRMNKEPRARDVLSTLALLPDGLNYNVFGSILKHQTGVNRALAVLKQTALAIAVGTGDDAIIRVLAPIRQYMLRHHPPPPLLRYSLEMYVIELAALSSKLGTSEGKATTQIILPQIGNMHSVVSAVLRDYVNCEGVWRDGQSIEMTVEAAIRLTRIYRYTSRGSKETCELAIEAAKMANMEKLRAEATYVLAQLYHRVFAEREKAEQLAISAIEIYSQIEDMHSMAECYHLRGVLAKIKPDANAMSFYELGLQFAEKSGNEHCEAKCLSSLSELKTNVGLNDEGVRLSERALDIFKKLNDYMNMGFTTFWLGRIAEQRSRYSMARKYYEESTNYFRQSGSQRVIVRPLNQLGDIAYYQCDYTEALNSLDGALKILEELGEQNRSLASFIIVSRAFVHTALNDLEKATSDVERAMSNFLTMKFHYGQVQCHICIGDIAFQRREYKKAGESYQEAVRMAEAGKQNTELGLAKRQLSKLLLHEGKVEVALQVCSSVFQTYVSIDDLFGKAHCMQVLGDIFLAMKNVASAEASYASALHFLRPLHAVRDAASCLLGLGRVAKLKRMNREAAWFLQEAESIFSKSGERDGEGECREELRGLFKEPEEKVTTASPVMESKA